MRARETAHSKRLARFHDVLGNRDQVSKLPSWMWLNADAVAKQGLDAAARGEVVYVTGRVNQAIASSVKLLPSRPLFRLVKHGARRLRKQV